MPFMDVESVRVFYECTGPIGAPVVAFSNSLGTDRHMWDAQVAALEDRYRILVYDTRGHGQSSASKGPYSIEQLANDFLHLLDFLSVSKCHFCGLSMGGMIGLWLAIHREHRLQKLILANTAPRIGTAAIWNRRIATVRKQGLAVVANNVIANWFTPEFQQRQAGIVANLKRMFVSTNGAAYIGCCQAIRDMDQWREASTVQLPTLIISGERDPVTPPQDAELLEQSIAQARHVKLEAAHLSNVERTEEFTNTLVSFLEG